jgi:hypothetical protein
MEPLLEAIKATASGGGCLLVGGQAVAHGDPTGSADRGGTGAAVRPEAATAGGLS